ncbi:MAG: type II toxin-antitoxin system RelE/ParE family toxin [Tepidiformaceae bacterium]
MLPKVSFDPGFESDLEEVTDFLVSRSISAAERFADEFESAVEQILAYPNSGTPALGRAQRVRIDNGPYSIIYDFEVETSTIVFLAVAHAARRPGYWKSRL